MALEFDDSQHYGFFLSNTTLTSSTGHYVRMSALVLAALRAAGLLDNMEDGTTPPATDKFWLDKNTDPPVLKEWDATGSSWQAMTFKRMFERAAVTPMATPTGTANALVVAAPSPFISNRLYSLTPVANNTGATTIQVTGVGTYDARYPDGSALDADEFRTGYPTILLFTGVRFEVLFKAADFAALVAQAEAARDDVLNALEAIGLPETLTANTMLVTNAGATAREDKTFVEVRGLIQPYVANTMLVDNADGTARENKTFDEIKALLGSNYDYDTIAAFEAATIPLVVQVIRVGGYYAPGDGGAHQKFRIATPDTPKASQTQAGDGSWWQIDAPYIDPCWVGARADAVRARYADGAITASDNTLTSASAAFSAADIGKRISVYGAGTAGANHVTTIASINSATSIELTDAAVTTVSNVYYAYGTDDTDAIQDAIDTGLNVLFQKPGYYYYTNLTVDTAGQRIEGTWKHPVGGDSQYYFGINHHPVLLNDLDDGSVTILLTEEQCTIAGMAFHASHQDQDKTLVRFATATDTDDCDGKFVGNFVLRAKTAVEHVGRSILFEDNTVATCNVVLKLDWPASGVISTGDNQDPPLRFRATRVINNRVHTCPQFIVHTGDVLRAAIIALNDNDLGDQLLWSDKGIDGCIIQSNVCDSSASSSVYIEGVCKDSVIANNVFRGVEGTQSQSPPAAVEFYGPGGNPLTINGLTVIGNSFVDIDAHAFAINGTITSLANISYTNNVHRNVGQDGGGTRSIILLGYSVSGLVVTGNVCRGTAPPYFIYWSTATKTLSYSYIVGNSWDESKTFANAFTDDGTNTIMIKLGALHVDASGRLGVGTISPSTKLHAADSTGTVLRIQRTGSTSGVVIAYQNDAGSFTVGGTPTGTNTGSFTPGTDNQVGLGSGSLRWTQLFAGTATISTSDERLKEAIEAINDMILDAWADVEWCSYRFIGGTRTHIGLIAQRVEAVFEEHGLEPFELGILCYDEWDADEDMSIEAGGRYGIRYEEALSLEAAYQRREISRLKAAAMH